MNEPAFPTGIITDDKGKIIGGSNGMTLRDYFAAKAMQGIIFDCLETKDTAKFAYELADEMLKARNGNS